MAHGLTKLLPYWHDNRQRLPIRRHPCLLEYSQCDILTVSRLHLNVKATELLTDRDREQTRHKNAGLTFSKHLHAFEQRSNFQNTVGVSGLTICKRLHASE
jgi:hypothetical protein